MLLDGDAVVIAAFRASAYTVRVPIADWERRQAAALRRTVFCEEQRLFERDDTDAIDAVATPIVALAWNGPIIEQVVGTVRIHDQGDGLWYGSRLAVERSHRRIAGLGAALVRSAVCRAHAAGCRRFLATVQPANVRFFETLNWRVLGARHVCGVAHALMQADLDCYPPAIGVGQDTMIAPRRCAA